MMSMPPTSVDVRMLMAAPSASNCAAEAAGARERRRRVKRSQPPPVRTRLPGYLQRELARGRQHQREEGLRLVQQRLAAATAET